MAEQRVFVCKNISLDSLSSKYELIFLNTYIIFVHRIFITNLYNIIVLFHDFGSLKFSHQFISFLLCLLRGHEQISSLFFGFDHFVFHHHLLFFTLIKKDIRFSSLLKVIHIHFDIRKMYLHHFHIIIFPVLFLCMLIIKLQYNHVLTL